jgi:hypothetical protein
MDVKSTERGRLVLVAVLGAMGGGLAVTLATRAIPRLVDHTVSKVVQGMSDLIGEEGCSPADI